MLSSLKDSIIALLEAAGLVRVLFQLFHTNYSAPNVVFDHQSQLNYQSKSQHQSKPFLPRQAAVAWWWWWCLQCLPDRNVITWGLWWYDGPSVPGSISPPPLPPPPLRSTTYCSQCINLSRILANLINQEMQKYPRNTNKHFHSGIVFPKHSTLCPDYTIIQSRPPLRSEPELLQFTFLTRFCSRFECWPHWDWEIYWELWAVSVAQITIIIIMMIQAAAIWHSLTK